MLLLLLRLLRIPSLPVLRSTYKVPARMWKRTCKHPTLQSWSLLLLLDSC